MPLSIFLLLKGLRRHQRQKRPLLPAKQPRPAMLLMQGNQARPNNWMPGPARHASAFAGCNSKAYCTDWCSTVQFISFIAPYCSRLGTG